LIIAEIYATISDSQDSFLKGLSRHIYFTKMGFSKVVQTRTRPNNFVQAVNY